MYTIIVSAGPCVPDGDEGDCKMPIEGSYCMYMQLLTIGHSLSAAKESAQKLEEPMLGEILIDETLARRFDNY